MLDAFFIKWRVAVRQPSAPEEAAAAECIFPRKEGQGTRGGSIASAFTLVELLIVLTLLAIVVSFAAPSLGRFFKGRNLDSEARRLLALSRMGQNRAVNEGVPMYLWIDTSQRSYGLEEEPGWIDDDPKAVRFELSPDLKMEVVSTNRPASVRALAAPVQATVARLEKQGLPGIRFLPDGTFAETSISAVRLYDREGSSVWLAQTEYRSGYEIRDQGTK